jgi:hypothetical protein
MDRQKQLQALKPEAEIEQEIREYDSDLEEIEAAGEDEAFRLD